MPADAAMHPEVWASDRDAQALVGLDGDLLELARVPLRSPLELGARADGGLWVVSALESSPLGAHELLRLASTGDVLRRVPLAPVLDLSVHDGDQALVVQLDPAGVARILALPAEGETVELAAVPDALSCAGRGGRVLVGTGGGVLLLLGLPPGPGPAEVLARRQLGGILADVAAGPRGDLWWVLDAEGGSGGARLLLVDEGLGLRWSADAGLAALHLIPVPGVERAWLADASAPRARRFGPGGQLELDVGLPLTGLDRGRGLPGGGVLLAAPGALLRLDAAGDPLPGQGGFEFLVDVERARP